MSSYCVVELRPHPGVAAIKIKSLSSQGSVCLWERHLSQRFPTFQAPGTGFMEDSFRGTGQAHCIYFALYFYWEFSDGTVVKNLPSVARRCKWFGFNPWLEKIPWGRRWQPLRYSCLENLMDRGALWATVHGVAKSRIQLITHALHLFLLLLHQFHLRSLGIRPLI